MENTESKNLLLSVFGVALLILIITGITYAMFRYTSQAEKTNVITTGAIKMSYIESNTNVISINDALPISDEVGKRQEEYFDFTLSSTITGLMTINYEIRATEIPIDNELNPNQIKIYLEKFDGGEYKEVLSPTRINFDTPKGMLLYEDLFENSEDKTSEFSSNYRLRIWLAEDEQLESISKSLKIKVDVYAKV